MGFCLLNNIAVTAFATLTARGDTGVDRRLGTWHHGNGTQAIFWNDPSVLYVSTHSGPFTREPVRPDEVGGPAALGLTLNVPLPGRRHLATWWSGRSWNWRAPTIERFDRPGCSCPQGSTRIGPTRWPTLPLER